MAVQIKVDEQDLKAATIRERKNADSVAEKTGLDETIDILQRAIGIIKKDGHGAFSKRCGCGHGQWCEENNKNLGFEIQTLKAEVGDLTATIEQETSVIDSLTAKQGKLAAQIHVDEPDLKAATIRERED